MSTRTFSGRKPTDNIMTKLKSNIRNIFNCKRVCGICLNKTRNLRLGNTIYSISCGENITERSLFDIISLIFGSKVTSLLPTSYFCESCIDVILQAYRMVEEIKFNHHILQYYANKLTEQLKMKLPDDVQSIVFELDYPQNSKPESYTNYSDEHSNDQSDFEDEKEYISKKETIETETVMQNDFQKESNHIQHSKMVTLEISEIMEKMKDQITFKKLKSIKTNDNKLVEKSNNNSEKGLPKNAKKMEILGKNKRELLEMKNQRYYKCYLCETTFTGENELLKHSRKLCVEPIRSTGINTKITSHNILTDSSKEVCDQCGKVVSSTYLVKHKRLHELVQKQCPVCTQFINKASYDRHLEAHSGQPKLKLKHCPHCDYVTRFSEPLDAHINKVHLHVSPYTCETCHKSFHSKLLLREHVKIHTRLKTEQCHICGDRFAYKKSLVLHMRIHTGYKPYKCDLCEESFLSASRRQIHKKTKHSTRNLQCDICLKKFFLSTTLRRHLIKVHGGKNREKNS